VGLIHHVAIRLQIDGNARGAPFARQHNLASGFPNFGDQFARPKFELAIRRSRSLALLC
jgi:hypothetical protein